MGGIFNGYFTRRILLSTVVEEFWKSANSGRSYWQEYDFCLLTHWVHLAVTSLSCGHGKPKTLEPIVPKFVTTILAPNLAKIPSQGPYGQRGEIYLLTCIWSIRRFSDPSYNLSRVKLFYIVSTSQTFSITVNSQQTKMACVSIGRPAFGWAFASLVARRVFQYLYFTVMLCWLWQINFFCFFFW